MKFLRAALLISACFAFYEESTFVQTITNENFEDRVRGAKDVWAVQFYKADDKASKKFSDEWENIARAFNGVMKVGAVDAVSDDTLAAKYNIDTFPAIVYFQKGSTKNYDGALNAKAISTFLIE
jgi:thioredoxin-like negative regulator of GroEL